MSLTYPPPIIRWLVGVSRQTPINICALIYCNNAMIITNSAFIHCVHPLHGATWHFLHSVTINVLLCLIRLLVIHNIYYGSTCIMCATAVIAIIIIRPTLDLFMKLGQELRRLRKMEVSHGVAIVVCV